MYRYGLAVLLYLFSGMSTAAPVVVLVPGFLNSLPPGSDQGPYFSSAIIETLQERATVYVIGNLLPIGTVAENGSILAGDLFEISRGHPGQAMVLLAHSAGGLYSLQALTDHPDLPVKTVVTLATPYAGADFVETLNEMSPEFETISRFFDLKSIREFHPERTRTLIDSFRVPERVRWVALAGSQKPCYLSSCTKADRLPWLLTVIHAMMQKPSDGVVTVDSQLGRGIQLRRRDGMSFAPEHWEDLDPKLDHLEMAGRPEIFHWMGVIDTDPIDRLQRQLYNELLNRLGFL